jgi:AcrR family transcriptional regulator
MPPDERRAQIVDCARSLFAQRPVQEVSTADVAEAAGVTRALVHHYFGDVRGVYRAVGIEMGRHMAEVRRFGPETPIERRIPLNVSAYLDVVEANRETWLATAGQADTYADNELRQLATAAREQNVERILELNSDVLEDTPVTRFCLRSFVGLSNAACRQWLGGQGTREQAQELLTRAHLDLLRRTIPALRERERDQ